MVRITEALKAVVVASVNVALPGIGLRSTRFMLRARNCLHHQVVILGDSQ